MRKNIKRIPLYFVLFLLLLFMGFWGYSFIRNELLTHAYYDDFKYAYRSNSMLGEMEYFKVLDCDDNTAKIYCVLKNMSAGNLLYFEKVDGNWTETRWETVWSASGSASDVIWPYWWHFIYGGL